MWESMGLREHVGGRQVKVYAKPRISAVHTSCVAHSNCQHKLVTGYRPSSLGGQTRRRDSLSVHARILDNIPSFRLQAPGKQGTHSHQGVARGSAVTTHAVKNICQTPDISRQQQQSHGHPEPLCTTAWNFRFTHRVYRVGGRGVENWMLPMETQAR